MAKGLLTARKNVTQATARPPRRRPATQKSGRETTEITPERARTATSLCPNTAIQPCSST